MWQQMELSSLRGWEDVCVVAAVYNPPLRTQTRTNTRVGPKKKQNFTDEGWKKSLFRNLCNYFWWFPGLCDFIRGFQCGLKFLSFTVCTKQTVKSEETHFRMKKLFDHSGWMWNRKWNGLEVCGTDRRHAASCRESRPPFRLLLPALIESRAEICLWEKKDKRGTKIKRLENVSLSSQKCLDLLPKTWWKMSRSLFVLQQKKLKKSFWRSLKKLLENLHKHDGKTSIHVVKNS